MFRGLFQLTWLELKIFLREPLGAIGSLLFPVLAFLILERTLGGSPRSSASAAGLVSVGLPVFASIMIAINAVLSLVTIISIYRDDGILKRLRATPLRPHTILTAHVLVKILMSTLTLALLVFAGKRFVAVGEAVPILSFALALAIATTSILSIGFLIASIVPTARFAQPIGAVLFYPMLGLSGLFFPIAALPEGLRAIARVLPLTPAVSLLQGIWQGESWSAHGGDLAGLGLVFV
ncbi:MAG: ABC transporter permease, partial [Vicinamibacteria bacterium]